jgi:membrane protein implicated in regulation of membrane protease activity
MFNVLFRFEPTALLWLAVAFVATVIEISVPHFGSAFVAAGAVAAAAASFLGYGLSVQLSTFIVVLVISLVTLRSRLLGRLGGPGVPSRTAPLVGRHGIVTQDVEPVLGRVIVGGEDWAARVARLHRDQCAEARVPALRDKQRDGVAGRHQGAAAGEVGARCELPRWRLIRVD